MTKREIVDCDGCGAEWEKDVLARRSSVELPEDWRVIKVKRWKHGLRSEREWKTKTRHLCPDCMEKIAVVFA